MILRTEKGYLHVGTDTDGSTTPDDVGWGQVARNKTTDFIGKRSLFRPGNQDPDRLQLVGLELLGRFGQWIMLLVELVEQLGVMLGLELELELVLLVVQQQVLVELQLLLELVAKQVMEFFVLVQLVRLVRLALEFLELCCHPLCNPIHLFQWCILQLLLFWLALGMLFWQLQNFLSKYLTMYFNHCSLAFPR